MCICLCVCVCVNVGIYFYLHSVAPKHTDIYICSCMQISQTASRYIVSCYNTPPQNAGHKTILTIISTTTTIDCYCPTYNKKTFTHRCTPLLTRFALLCLQTKDTTMSRHVFTFIGRETTYQETIH